MKTHKQAGEICVSPLVTVSSGETIERAQEKDGHGWANYSITRDGSESKIASDW